MILQRPESLEQFYSNKFDVMPETDNNDLGSFDVFNIEERVITGTTTPTFVRRDFYKIMLFQGKNTFHYSDESIDIEGDTLLFFNPQVPYTYDPLEKDTKGYFCVFREEFFLGTIRFPVKEHPLFSAGSKPVFSLTADQAVLVKDLFLKMAGEKASPFSYKYDLIRAYILELVFYALKLDPALHPSSEVMLQLALPGYLRSCLNGSSRSLPRSIGISCVHPRTLPIGC